MRTANEARLGARPPGLPASVLVHPLALVETAEIGEGTRVWGFSHVMRGARVGRDCNVCEGVFIEAGSVVGNSVTIKNGVCVWEKIVVEDGVFLGPAMVFTNHRTPRAFLRDVHDELVGTLVRQGATIGAGAVILPGLVIGGHAFVGAGSVVTRDVPAHALVTGNPARIRGYVCRCLGTRFAPGKRGGRCDRCGTEAPSGTRAPRTR